MSMSRDRRLLDVDRYPEIVFRSTEVAIVDEKWIVGGVLACRGAEHRLSRPKGTLVIRTTSALDRREFGVRAMKLVASSLLRIEVEVVAVRGTSLVASTRQPARKTPVTSALTEAAPATAPHTASPALVFDRPCSHAARPASTTTAILTPRTTFHAEDR
jgi:hypothetical protein